MKELVVLSGKGGTGKTSILASFAALAKNKVIADCDVSAADLYLLLSPAVKEQHEFWSGQVAWIDEKKCTRCSLCQEMCHFNAIAEFRVVPHTCEGCGLCSAICPAGAITMQPSLAGHWFVCESKYGSLIYAKLGIAKENSGKLVSLVRQKALQTAVREGTELIICDGPPGIGCPVISSLSGADLALLVTEPTLSGRSDLERILSVCDHFNVTPFVCINKWDINEDNTRQIETYCADHRVRIIQKIPFDNVVTKAIIDNRPVVEYSHGSTSRCIEDMWHKIEKIVCNQGGY